MNTRYLMGIRGFTIVELIVVISIIGILAGVTIVGYGSWRTSVTAKVVRSDLSQVQSAMTAVRNFGSGYPTSIPATFSPSADVTVTYRMGDITYYCIEAVSMKIPTIAYHINTQEGSSIQSGKCV